jgi:SRSO17 transposase
MVSVRDGEIVGARAQLTAFALAMFGGLTRSDQRVQGELYLRGLLLDGRRKSIRTMARQLGADYQALQQFVTSSTWDVASVRLRLARQAAEVLRPVAWVIDDTAFLKEGTGSPCVARQYARTVDSTANCQIGVGVHMVGRTGSAAVNWRLSVPESWDETMTTDAAERAGIAQRRRQCGIPDTERHRPNWAIALEMLAELTGWGLRAPVVVAGRHYGVHDEFRAALERLGMRYVVQVEKDSVVTSLGPATRQRVTWQESLGHSHFVARPIHGIGPAAAPRWLVAEQPDEATAPVRYWVSTLSEVSQAEPLARLDLLRRHHDHRELSEVTGLDHFQGRSWVGWNRHVTLASAAHLFRTAPHPGNTQAGTGSEDREPETSGAA